MRAQLLFILVPSLIVPGTYAGAQDASPPDAGAAAHGAHGKPSALSSLTSLAQGAVLFDDLGTFQRKVTTRSPEAQAFFDQGMRLTYAFNHDEAARSFARAAQLDPSCASCFWGVALVLGPNYNVPMLPDRAATAWTALQKAQALAPTATPTEQALIGALSRRYLSHPLI
ncbi:hypothetical protein [Corallococcus exiguus]|uniref:hypothetical protein n=1 Tax=Corallococcus exiguus TaxID=83462 RepID=UPI001C254654|nr:hypothetical protein [Corallococcus exiguus]NRD52988.1 hypothetical protein [Corallococcus exiguus]